MSPVNGFLLDRFGYGIVLLVINTLSIASIAIQMLDNLEVQVWRFCCVLSAQPVSAYNLEHFHQVTCTCTSPRPRLRGR